MKTLPLGRQANYRRRIRYVDGTVQKLLLLGLVLLEALLAAGLVWWMWHHLNQVIDDSLYRVHLAEAVPILTQLTQETLFLSGVFFGVNLIALLLADLIWRRYVNSILRFFVRLMSKTAVLDFSVDPEINRHHQVLDLALSQRDQDRQRLTEFRSRLSALTPALLAPGNAAAASDSLQALHQLLPRTHAGTTTPKPPGKRRFDDAF